MTGDGAGVVAHAGSVATRMLADRTGLTGQLSGALKRRSFTPVHDRGQVLVDVAVMLADGGEAIADIEVLRHQAPVLGAVASPPTVWRALGELTPAALRRIQHARARVRRHVWTQLAGSGVGVPASKVAGTDLGDVVVLDVDATIVVAHSEKELASPTFKKTFGFHPLAVWCDNTQEMLAGMLRTGRAGSNTAVDHITVLTDAIAQVPAAHRKRLLVRCDGAGASHALLDWLTAQGEVRGRSLEYSVGFPVTENVRDAIPLAPRAVWTPATDADGGVRDGGDVAELTGLMDPAVLVGWPAGMRIIVRRQRPHPGAQLSLFEHRDGWRYQAVATNTPQQPGVQLHPGAQLSLFEHRDGWRYQAVATNTPQQPGVQLALLEARPRAHARVEDRIRHAKDTGLGRFPSREFTINQAWLTVTAIAADLVAWLRLFALTGDAAALATCEPKALCYRLLHVPARLTHGGRRRRLRLPATWPWVNQIVAVFANIAAIPEPC